MLTKEEWLEICKNADKWCSYEEVKDYTYEQAVDYVKHMSVFVPM